MKKVNLNVQRIITLYNGGLSCKKISEEFSVAEPTIRKLLIKNNIKIRSLREAHLIKKFDESFFNKIDSEAKAYWLGFIYADGSVRVNVHKRGYKSYVTTIAQAEKEPLEKFIKCIAQSDIKITEYLVKKTNSIVYSISLNSETLFNDLNNQGCIPNKSLVLKFPTKIPDELVHHFIRGYFDGDGSVYKSDNVVKYQTHTATYAGCDVSICGTLEFLTELKNNLVFMGERGIHKEKRKLTNTWTLRLSGHKRVILFYDYIYKDASIFLQRKKDKFEQVIKERGSTTIIGTPKRTPSHLVTNRRVRSKG